jgi:hypothetical protein
MNLGNKRSPESRDTIANLGSNLLANEYRQRHYIKESKSSTAKRDCEDMLTSNHDE